METALIIVLIILYRIGCGVITYKVGLKRGSKKYFWVGLILGSLGVLGLITDQGFSTKYGMRIDTKNFDDETQWICPKCKKINLKRDSVCKCGGTLKEYIEELERHKKEKYLEELKEKGIDEEEVQKRNREALQKQMEEEQALFGAYEGIDLDAVDKGIIKMLRLHTYSLSEIMQKLPRSADIEKYKASLDKLEGLKILEKHEDERYSLIKK